MIEVLKKELAREQELNRMKDDEIMKLRWENDMLKSQLNDILKNDKIRRQIGHMTSINFDDWDTSSSCALEWKPLKVIG